MKNLIHISVFTAILTCLSNIVFTQNQVVFTSLTNDTIHEFWRVNVDTPFVFDNISQKLDMIAPLQGKDYGPIIVSHDGNWYAFTSERFDADAQGWAALTITNSDFSTYEVIHDSTGQLIHSEGIAYVLSGGNTIVFTADFGNHNKDIFIIHKTGANWGMPRNLTVNSSYDFNYCPYVSSDGLKVLFDASNTPFPSTAIGEMNIDGSGIGFPITASSLPSGIAVHSACYGIDGSIIFEGDASGERLWWLPYGSLTTYLINASYGNDNSPVTLPDGRIASLWLPGGWHEIKIMNSDGTNGYMLTDSSSLFTEVFDVGISACPAYVMGVNEVSLPAAFKVFPNPSSGIFYLTTDKIETYKKELEIYNVFGEKVYSIPLMKQSSNKIDISDSPKGIYLLKLIKGEKTYSIKIIIQ